MGATDRGAASAAPTDHTHTPPHLRDPAKVIGPDYARVAVSLSDAELEEEILSGRGEPGYKLALVAEHERRAKRGA